MGSAWLVFPRRIAEVHQLKFGNGEIETEFVLENLVVPGILKNQTIQFIWA